MVMEGLCRMIDKLEQNGLYEGFKVSQYGKQVTHLLFADDTLFFSNDSPDQIQVIRATLIWFQLCSGLGINPSKSSAISIGNTSCNEIVNLILGCSIEELPINYLGMPTGGSYRSKFIWDIVIERTKNILQGWSSKFLTYGGRRVQIQNVLSSPDIYLMSVYSMPKSVSKKLNGVLRRYLWNSTDSNKKYPLVAWNKCCQSKERGGLGIQDLNITNDALLCK
ncbi:uncharacterized protein LOC113357517 [Papaver somniferum]|uniref:uncharacterized protein LOC113357517 n=1 Tax=Papaver somniferum TaxID=3469 RepID=UPI000E7057A2|nr:uncharacterized protein LOC113357517 [Papaver somniferum]